MSQIYLILGFFWDAPCDSRGTRKIAVAHSTLVFFLFISFS
jgi:hypothetical protein